MVPATTRILELPMLALFALKAPNVLSMAMEFTVTQQHVQPQSTVPKELLPQLHAQIGMIAQTTRCVKMDTTSLLIK